MENEIILNHRNEGSFFGKNGVRYVYTPKLRARIDECFAAAKRSSNRFFVLEGETVRAAQSTREGALQYMKDGYVLLSIKGCGRHIHVEGTNGGTMPCGANLTQFGQTAPYYCFHCEQAQ